MNQYQIEARKYNGKEIAERFKISMKDGVWRVPSSKSPRKFYEVIVDPTNVSCTCPDHAETRQSCKHIYAVEYILRGGDDPVETPDTGPPGPKRPTYPRDFAKINAAQTREEDEFEPLLYTFARRSHGLSIGGAVAPCRSRMPCSRRSRRSI
jgi:hypothetical protein